MSWGAISIGSAVVGAVGTSMAGKKKGAGYEWSTAPEYEEAEGARKLLWENLQGYNAENSYGAITPDWAEIWDRSKKKVNEYYQGTALQPGAFDKVKASAARRGVSDSPAMEYTLAALGAEQGSQLRDIASDQAISEKDFAEQARMDYLNRVEGLSQQKPQSAGYYNEGKPTTSARGGAGLAALGSAGSAASTMGMQNEWLKKLTDNTMNYNSPAGQTAVIKSLYRYY